MIKKQESSLRCAALPNSQSGALGTPPEVGKMWDENLETLWSKSLAYALAASPVAWWLAPHNVTDNSLS